MTKKVINDLRFGVVPNENLRDITVDFEEYVKSFDEIIKDSNIMHFALGPNFY